jgi:drug/metabolite transporter (DMT)-like permease
MAMLSPIAAGPDVDLFGRDVHYHVVIPASVVGLALAAALSYALAAALQHAATQSSPSDHAMRWRLLWGLVRRPMWLLGNVADAAAFVLLFLAFRRGSLILVQPLLVSGLLFALLIGTVLTHHRLRPADWMGVGLVVVGLSVFIMAAAPGPGHPRASPAGWTALAITTIAVVGTLIGLAQRRPDRRAPLLGAAAGVLNAVLGGITEAAARAFDSGVLGALQRWEPYVLVAVGLIAILVVQSAFHAGKLHDSLPLITATETLGGIAIGHFLFSEAVANHPFAHVLQVLGLALLCVGIFVLGRSPVVAPDDDEEPAATIATGRV